MKTKKIEVADVIKIDVSCEYNDPVDIRCGGPAVLGYDFFVSPDTNIKDIISKIKSYLKKYDRPLINISTYKVKNFDIKYLWTIEKIEKCIKTHNI